MTQPHPELILTGARIYTVDPSRPWAEAIAVDAGRITAIGSRDEIAALVSSPIEFTGAARAQVSAVASRVAGLAAAYPEAAAYSPGAIL